MINFNQSVYSQFETVRGIRNLNFLNDIKNLSTIDVTVKLHHVNFMNALEFIKETVQLTPVDFVVQENSDCVAYFDDFYVKVGISNMETDIVHTSIIITGEYEKVRGIYEKFKKYRYIQSQVEWKFMKADGSVNSIMFDTKTSSNFYEEAYPFIKPDVETFIDEYFASNANFLLLLGPPGTGKSTLLSHMITTRDRRATITYDRDLLCRDELYLSFLSSNQDTLIIEDADTLLYSREKEGNHILSKILNAADGIVDSSNKKIIFTANIENRSKIDSAIIRPGRCYDIVDFRNLTNSEANCLLTAQGKDATITNNDVSLAEIYNSKEVKTFKMGF